MISILLSLASASMTPAKRIERALEGAYVLGRCSVWHDPDEVKRTRKMFAEINVHLVEMLDLGIADSKTEGIKWQTCERLYANAARLNDE